MSSPALTQKVPCSRCGVELTIQNPHLGEVLCADCVGIKSVTLEFMQVPRFYPRGNPEPDWDTVLARLERIEQKLDQLLSGGKERA